MLLSNWSASLAAERLSRAAHSVTFRDGRFRVKHNILLIAAAPLLIAAAPAWQQQALSSAAPFIDKANRDWESAIVTGNAAVLSAPYATNGVFVAPDGTVWLNASYRDTDNDANPPGGLVWALGQSGTSQIAPKYVCFPGEPDNSEASGVTCFDPATETSTKYLANTHINAVAAAPDGTFWAAGSDGSENGGLYHITPK